MNHVPSPIVTKGLMSNPYQEYVVTIKLSSYITNISLLSPMESLEVKVRDVLSPSMDLGIIKCFAQGHSFKAEV